MIIKEQNENCGQLPEFISEENRGYFFDNVWEEGDCIFNYQTKWSPNTEALKHIAERFNVDFILDYGLISKINEIHEKLNAKTAPKQEVFLDNEELIAMLKISRRTAQTWRDEGKISFSQVGSKIYYKLSDVERTMQDHYNKSFAKK